MKQKIILLGVFVLIILSPALLFFRHSMWASKKALTITQGFLAKEEKYRPLFTTIFDKAERENVRADIDALYDEELGGSVRMPLYFIRLKDNKIQKLFQGGDLKIEDIDTKEEEWIAQMLRGERPTLEFPQYTCCGGDDIWPQLPLLKQLLPQRRYLKDFPSELEIIIPLLEKEKINGGIIYLYGD